MQEGPMPAGPAGDMATMGGVCCTGNQGIPSWEAYGDFMYIRPRNANVAYGVVFNGPPDTAPTVATPLQVAPPGIASIDYHPGFRTGFSKALDECNAVVATFTHYEGEDRDEISTNQYLIRSMVSQPSTWSSNAASDWLQAASDYSMIFNLADIDFRWTFENQNDTRLSLFGGFEAQRRTPIGLVIYGRTAASAVAGTFRCAYTQSNVVAGPAIDTGYSADRVVPMLDAELGTGFSLWDDKLRLTVGYSFSAWFNLVRTDQFIGAVQANNFSGMSDGLSFDGFVARAELQF
jgi:hypothetical protein